VTKTALRARGKMDETQVAEKLTNELSKFAKVEINAQRIRIFLPSPVLFETGKVDLKPEAIDTLKEIAKSIKTIKNVIIVEGHTDNIPLRGGRYGTNWELSAARAFSVIRYFIEQENIPPARFSVYGYGEFRPAPENQKNHPEIEKEEDMKKVIDILNGTEEERARNRRIEINIIRA
jgi:chemotaxis protein MotB